jgi:uncharacterized membrane protein YsdA (DUF1294 family)
MSKTIISNKSEIHNPWISVIIPSILLAFLCIIGVRMIYQVTPFGVGINGDSYQYLTGADTLTAGYGIGHLDGGGQFEPLTLTPPMLSIILAGMKLTGMDGINADRYLDAVLFGLNILLVALILKKTTHSYVFSLVGAGLILISPMIIKIHTWLWSEPPFLFFELAGILALAISLEKQRRGWLLIASISIGLASLTRYTGIALIATGVIALLLNSHTDLRRKSKDITIFILTSCTPLAIWMVRNYILTGNSANRNIGWHPMTLIQRHEGIDTVLSWVFPSDFINHKEKVLVLILVLFSLAVLIYWFYSYYKNKDNTGKKWPIPGIRFLFSVLILTYIGMLVVSITVVYQYTPLDFRILSPIQVPVIILLVTSLADFWKFSGIPGQVIIAAFSIYLLLMYSQASMKIIPELQSAGQGYSNQSWRSSEVIQAVKNYPDSAIITNQITGIYIWAGRNSWFAPWKVNLDEHETRADYQEQLDLMRERLRAGAILVLYRPENLPDEQWSISDLTQGLTLIENFPDGMIYKHIP